MIQVLFDEIKSWDDLHMMLIDVDRQSPVPKRTVINIPGRNGVLDLTASIGKQRYENINVILKFAIEDYSRNWMEIFAEIREKLHAKKMHVSIGENSEWYYDAFVTVNAKNNNNMGTVIVNLDAYAFEMAKTEYNRSVIATPSGTTVTAPMRYDLDVVPVFSTNGTVACRFNGQNYEFDGAGDHESADIVFQKGNNTVKLTGNNINVTITFREGRL